MQYVTGSSALGHNHMASLSRSSAIPIKVSLENTSFWPPAHAAAPGEHSWLALVDADGVIQSLDGPWPAGSLPAARAISVGSSYRRFLTNVCGDNHERVAAVSAAIRAVAAGQEETFSVEFFCRMAGSRVRLRLAAVPYKVGDFEGVLMVHAILPEAPENAQAQRDPQADKMEALGRLTSGVAHDFANLLTLISGYSEMILGRIGVRDPLRPELEEIRKAAARGAGMTSQILDFIRRQVSQPKALSLNALVGEIERLLRPIIGEHIELVTALSADLGNVKADPVQMTRVIMNLVLNARDAMPRGGQISIRTSNLELSPDESNDLPAGRYVVLSLSDTGQGMSQETASQIFEPFFTTKKAGDGTGLGLSTVYDIVKQMEGDIRVSSELGNGSTFTICLPRADEPDEVSESPILTPARGASGSETILVAEDEESVRRLIKHLLAARGYNVLEAVDGSDALRVFEQHSDKIDLLLTDMVMPGLNGRDLAQRILEQKPRLKIIYISGYTDDMLLSTGALGPGMSFLRKPLKPDVLAGRIREVLDAPPRQ